MQMDFKVYQLTYAGDLTKKGQTVYEYLRRLAKIPGEHGFEYCITSEVDYQSNLICGCLSEEYPPNINSVDDDRNVYVPDVSPYLNTFFVIDLSEKRLLVQHREYPAPNLDRHQTLVRLVSILKTGFERIYNAEFDYVDTNRDVTDEEFIDVFYNNRITLMRVKIFPHGRLLRDSASIFEDEHLNQTWIEGWNSDESEMHEILLKAPGRSGTGDLRESPIAISLLNLPVKEILELNYWNEDDSAEYMSRTDLKKFRVRGIDRHTQPITAIDHLLTDIRQRRHELRKFIAFQPLA